MDKNTDINWTDANGQFSIKSNAPSTSGKWTLDSYTIGGTTTTVTNNNEAGLVPITYAMIGDNTEVVLNYTYTAASSAVSQGLYIEDAPNAVWDTAAGSSRVGWNYTTTVTTDTTTTTPADKTADVTVKYYVVTGMNSDGTPNVKAVDGGATKTATVGSTYTVSEATLDGYTFLTSNKDLSGTVSETAADNEIDLFYVENTALNVSYQDENGNTLAADQDFEQGADGTFTQAGGTYSVAAPTLTATDGTTYEYVGYKIGDGAVQTGNVAAGTLASGVNQVTFVYKAVTTPVEDTADLTINYVDADGNKIKDSDVTSSTVGSDYTVTTPDIDGYTYDHSTGDALTGTIANGGTTVTLVYTKNAVAEDASVVVKYVDANGKTIKADTTLDGKKGDSYTVATPDIDGYTYTSASDSLTGTYDGVKTITLTYTAKAVTPVEQSTITVKYVDANGKTIATDTTLKGDNGSSYTVDTPAIDGYTYTSASDSLTGTYASDKTITLTYTANKPAEAQANLTINYVDENGNTIKASSVTSHKVGDAYTVATPEIAGYVYDHSTGDNIAGTINYAGNTITLVYKSNGTTTPTEQTKTITVKYVDANGKTIKTATSTSYKVGDTYTVATPAIDGYTYTSADGALTGTVSDDATITLTYAQNDNGGTTTTPGGGDNGGTTTAPGGDNGGTTTAPGNGGTTTAPDNGGTTTAPDNGGTTTATTGDNTQGSTAPATTPNNNSKTSTGTTATATTPATSTTTAAADEVTTNGTSGVVPATAATTLKPVTTTTTTTSSKDTLPQTDEENGTALAVLGLSTLLMGSALYFGASKRRKHEA